MKKRIWQIGGWSVALVILWLVVRTVPLDEVLQTLARLRPWQLGILVVLNSLVLVGLNGRWWLILYGLGYRLPFWPLLGHRLAAFGVSYFTPGPQFGGEPLQVLLVERRHGVPRPAAIAAVSLDKMLELLINFGFLALGSLAVASVGLFGTAVGLETAFLVGLLLTPSLLYLRLIWRGQRPLSGLLRRLQRRLPWGRLGQLQEGMARTEQEMNAVCHQNPRPLLAALLVSILSWGLLILEFFAMASFLGLPLTLLQLIALLTAARIAFLLPLPGGLGTLEASQVWALGLLGLNPAAGLAISLLIRLRDVSLGLLGLWWAGRRLKLEWIRP